MTIDWDECAEPEVCPHLVVVVVEERGQLLHWEHRCRQLVSDLRRRHGVS